MVAKLCLYRGTATAFGGVVHHIVVDECGTVHHLHKGGCAQRTLVDLAKELCAEQHQDGTQAFALRLLHVAHDAVHGLGLGLHGLLKKDLKLS